MAEVESLSDGSEDSSMEVETTWKPMADVLLEFNGLQKLGRLFQAEGEDVIGPKYRFLRYEATVFDQQQHIKPHSLATLSWLKRGTFVYFDTFDDFEIKDEIYVVHHSYFESSRMFHFDKMVGMYTIIGDTLEEEDDLKGVYGNSQYRKFFGDADTMLNTVVPLSSIDFRDRMHQWYCFRMDLRELFHQKLFESKGRAAISFVMRATMQDFLNLIKTSASAFTIATAEPEHSLAVTGRSKKLFYGEIIYPQSTVQDVFHFVVMDTDALIPVLGDLWYCRVLVPHHQYQGDHLRSKYACVPHANSNVTFAFDVNSNHLFVSVPVVCEYGHDTSVNGMQRFASQLEMFQTKLSGADVYDPELDEYFRVCFVEYNATDFTEKKRRKRLYGCNIAWMLSYHDFEIREDLNLLVSCSDPENVDERKLYAVPFSLKMLWRWFQLTWIRSSWRTFLFASWLTVKLYAVPFS
jgi:hypothetical protein